MKNLVLNLIFVISVLFSQSTPIADAGDDFNACRICWDINSSIFDNDYKIQLSGEGSSDPNNSVLTYSWQVPEIFRISYGATATPRIRFDWPNLPNTEGYPIDDLDISLNYDFILTVSNGTTSAIDTVSLVFEPSTPIIPTVYSKSDSGIVVLTWTSDSENSVDSLTGYRDFEGYRIYKSLDGGITWGKPEDKIYFNGEYKGWKPYAQFDLTEKADTSFCNKEVNCNIEIPENIRREDIFGVDPLAPWVNLGDNTGLVYTFIDEDVYNGLEYTYTVVSYDMGLRTFSDSYSEISAGICTLYNGDTFIQNITAQNCCIVNGSTDFDNISKTCSYTLVPSCSNSFFCNDSDKDDDDDEQDCCENDGGIWSEDDGCDIDNVDWQEGGLCYWQPIYDYEQDWYLSNPDELSFENGTGFVSLECPIIDQNTATAIPGFYAENIENISYAGVEPAEGIILSREPQNIGNGGAYFVIVNEDDLSGNSYRFEIKASIPLGTQSDLINVYGTDFDKGFKTGEPSLYIYQINLNDTSAIFSDVYTKENLSESEIEDYLSFPGAYSTDSEVYVPEYLLEDFPIKYLDEPGASTNFTDFFDGIKFRFDNSIKYIYSNDGKAVVNRLLYITTNEITGARDTTDISESNAFNIGLEYGNGGDSFTLRPPYSYKLTLSKIPNYEVGGVENGIGNTLSGDAYTDPCPHMPSNSMLPFKITNLTTNKKVGVIHTDNGTNYGVEGNCDEICSSIEFCNDTGICEELIGLNDCMWQRNESISFKSDTVYTYFDSENMSKEFTYVLKFDLPRLLSLYPSSIYESTRTYSVGDVVRHTKMLWEATEAVSENIIPTDWFDTNSDDVNDNPWIPIYPWENGDEIIIEPVRWYVDGDAWIANFSDIGKKLDIESDDLGKISVVPNPYLGRSEFNEGPDSGLMWFTHLPTLCRVSIYTVSGELVKTFDHNDDFSGQESWNLKSENGDEVAPGLYIYTVESGNSSSYNEFKHIGKFAIVR